MIKIIKNFNKVISVKQLSLGGFSLVELIVSVSIFLIFVIAVTGVISSVSTEMRNSANKERAAILAEEALEASRNIRDAGFANLTDGTYGLSTAGNEWSLSGTSDLTDIFTRVLNISTISENQKRVDVTISWADIISPTNSMTMSTYLTNWREILNTEVGLTVNKSVINHGGSKVASDFAPYKVTGIVLVGDPPVPTVVETPITIGEPVLLGIGSYTVLETTDPDYIQTFSGDCDSNGVVNLIANTVNTCVITNEEKPSSLVVNKTVINHSGSKVVSDFTILVDSNPVVSGETNIFNSGSHTVSEINDPLYDLTISGDCDGNGVVNLSPGTIKTCTLTNEEKAIDCTGTPWGTMASGTSDTAYLASSPSGACTSETRTCTNGVLSGSYTATSCIAGCTGTPWGDVSTGYSNIAYQASNVTYPSVCVSEIRTCTAGTMSGSYTNTSCTVTNVAPTVTTTSPVTSITQTSAIGGGNITSNGGSTVTVSGLVWSTSLNPTTADSKTTDGWGLGGPWTSTMSSLTCGTSYYVRAYATNSIGTSYGSNVSFATSACNVIPTVTTPTNTLIASTSAILGANVTSLGIPASISARGICYGETSSPTNCVPEGITTLGVFTQNITSLIPGTLYYYRGYAINETGTAYSEDETFTTLAMCTTSLVGVPTFYNSSGSTSALVSKPTGVVPGDIMFAYILHVNGVDRLNSIPAGWLPFDGVTGRHKNGNYNQALYYKVAGASEPASYTFGLAANSKFAVTISAYRGCFNPVTPIDASSNVEYIINNTTYRASSMDLPSQYTNVLMFPSAYSTSTRTFLSPTTQGGGWIEDYDHGNTSPDFWRAGYRKLIISSGATGVIDSIGTLWGATVKHAFAVALSPL